MAKAVINKKVIKNASSTNKRAFVCVIFGAENDAGRQTNANEMVYKLSRNQNGLFSEISP